MRLSRLFQNRLAQGRRGLPRQGSGQPPVGLVETLMVPGTHEETLTQLFEGRMRFEGQDPVFPQPLMIIAFTNRSGSNLLCDYVAQSGRVGGAGEFLNHDVVTRRCAEAGVGSLPDYIRHLHQTLAGAQRMLALKASWDQWAMLLRHNIPAMFPRVIVLHCTRGDILGQAVSYAIALRNGRWIQLRQAGQADPPDAAEDESIPLTQIEAQMDLFHRANLLIRLLCEAHGVKRWDISYERLCQDKGAHLSAVLQAEGLVPAGWMPGTPRLERQAGPLNARLTAAMLERLRQATIPK